MKYIFHILSFIFLFFFLSLGVSFAAINFSFTPIRYELTMATGSTITKPATLKNNGSETVTITTGKSDFQSSGPGGTPSFVRKSELVFPDQELSSWITIDTPTFTIDPGEEVTINFTINVPLNATPGGHYGAVFFKNPNSESGTGGNIAINVDYGIIILINVEGTVVIGGGMGGVTVGGGTGRSNNNGGDDSSGGISAETPPSGGTGFIGITPPSGTYDDCPFGDFTASNDDGRCFDNPFSGEGDNLEDSSSEGGKKNDSETLLTDSTNNGSTPQNGNSNGKETINDNLVPLGEQEKFGIGFYVPFENTGNTHIKPSGKIILKDSEGNIIKAVGREAVINKLGAVIGEKIVDYIPINDTGGNVLPGTKRVFTPEWEGFPYWTRTESGEQVLDYWNPSEYYTKKNKEEAGFLMFWERVSETRKHEKITAFIDVSYTGKDGEPVEFNSARDFYIDYTEQYIGLNPYIILPFCIFWGLLSLYFLYWWFVLGKKKRKCKHCKTVVRKNWHVCPKCKKKIK